jgi:DNA invertase Pin-like site-specific DNA recombinase
MRSPVAIYLRVSTDKQDHANQEPDCLRLVEARGANVDEVEILREVESSAKERPVWRDMLERCRRGEIRTLVVWGLDRFGRSMWETCAAVKELDRLGVKFVSVREPWCDTDSPVRDLLLAVFAWVANHERDRLRERTLAGIEKAKRRGKRLGRPPTGPTGKALERAVELRQGGASWRLVARTLRIERFGQIDPATVRRAVLGAVQNGSSNGTPEGP